MKKIVGIIAAVAMAASVFAADFTAGTRFEGNIFSYNNGVSMLSLTNNNENYHKPFVLSVSSDKAGATVKINEKKSDAPAITNMNIWFKPVDMVKVEMGNVSEAMNTESMGWWRRVLNYDTWGFKATANIDALTVSAALLPGKKADAAGNPVYWLSKADGADATIAETNIYAAYNAGDIGTISAMADFTDTFKTYKIAAGYKNAIGPVVFFVDYLYDKNNTIDADVKFSQDALTCEAYSKVSIADSTAMSLVARVSYAIGNGLNSYVEFDCGNLLADSFSAGITASLSGSVSVMAWEVQATFNTASKAFAVPFNVAVSF